MTGNVIDVIAIVSLIGLLLTIIYTACCKYERYKARLRSCKYVRNSDIDRIFEVIDDLRRLSNNCYNATITQLIGEILEQMYSRIDYIIKVDEVTTKASKKNTQKLISDTVRIFRSIDKSVSEQVFKSVEETYDISDFKKTLYQLEAYNELRGKTKEKEGVIT